jgi:hypothetical protein
MADIRKFTGFVAIDGTTHTTIKAAIEHTRAFKIKEALKAFEPLLACSKKSEESGVDEDDGGNLAIYPSGLPAFLFNNREAIMAAFNQEAVIRAPRKTRSPKENAGSTTDAAISAQAAAAIADAAAAAASA